MKYLLALLTLAASVAWAQAPERPLPPAAAPLPPTTDLQTLERQLWSSMPAAVRSMLDFSRIQAGRGS